MHPTQCKEELAKYDDRPHPVEEKTWHEDGHKYTKIVQVYHEDYQDVPPYNQKRREANFKNDKQDGLTIAWHYDGQKEWEDSYKDDELHGLSTDWHSNGQKLSEVNYKYGKRHGLTIGWDENGQKELEENCNDGEVISQVFFENGEIVETLQATTSEPLCSDYAETRDRKEAFF